MGGGAGSPNWLVPSCAGKVINDVELLMVAAGVLAFADWCLLHSSGERLRCHPLRTCRWL